MRSGYLNELAAERTIFYPFTVKQYHEMIRTGILVSGDPYELLNGFIVRKDRSAATEDPLRFNPKQASLLTRLLQLNRKLERLGCFIQTQLPIELPPNDEPEPDASIIVGKIDDYCGRHPRAKDVACVIEIADSSLQRDRDVKQRIYAAAGIPQYIIINLADRVVEVFADPLVKGGRYGRCTMLTTGAVKLSVGRETKLSVPLRTLLP